MGTKVHCKSYIPGYYPMGDLNEDSSSSSWSQFHGEKNEPNVQDNNGFMQRTIVDSKDSMKQKILEQEAIFKNQVNELHRLYRIQRDMMEEIQRKELYKHNAPIEPSSSSSTLKDAQKWQMEGFPLSNYAYNRTTSFPGVEIANSSLSCTKGYNNPQPGQFQFLPKEPEPSDPRPSKVRKKLLDLQLPAEEYIDIENCDKKFNEERSIRFADLNEPIRFKQGTTPSSIDFLGQSSTHGGNKIVNQLVQPNTGYLRNGLFIDSSTGSKVNEMGWLSHINEAGSSRSYRNSAAQGLQQNISLLPSYPLQSMINQYNHPLNPASRNAQRTLNGFNHGPASDSRPVIDFNLNEVFSESSSNEAVTIQDLNMVDEKGKPGTENYPSSLPWLKPKPACGPVRDLNQLFSSEIKCEKENVIKILGVPICETVALKNERRNGMIDINLACEPDEQIDVSGELIVEEKMHKSGDKIVGFLDLNSCITDCEDPPVSSHSSKSSSVKVTMEIDLEAPVFFDSEYDKKTPSRENIELENLDEFDRNAAEALFSFSSSCQQIDQSEVSLEESLLWFVDAVSDELERKSGKELMKSCDFLEEMDDFEAMTLQLEVMKEKDYMPNPFIPEAVEESEGVKLPNRPRRGQARRGRQKRDFQRDILPGLTTLSRNEVTDDLQTFGSSSNSRNGKRIGGVRGRRRGNVETTPARVCAPLVKQLDVESSFDDRRLTGWGKTTRRPRGQRCHAGNTATVALV